MCTNLKYIDALHRLKKGYRIERVSNDKRKLIYYSYDLRTGIITVTQYNVRTIEDMSSTTYDSSYDMTIQEFIGSSKKNNYEFKS